MTENETSCYFLDEKEKYDPNSFRDAVIQGLNETGADLEKVSPALSKIIYGTFNQKCGYFRCYTILYGC